MINKTEYLNNEKRLYDYVVSNRNVDKLLITNDLELSKVFNVSKITVLRWRKRLVECGLINCSSKYVGGKKSLILSLNEIEEREV